MAGEHAALREWRWAHAWGLTHLPEPPCQQVSRKPDAAAVRPFARLASPSWVGAIMAYAKDVMGLQDAEKKLKGSGKGDKHTDKDE